MKTNIDRRTAFPATLSDEDLTSVSGGGTTGASEHGDILIAKFIDVSSPKLHDAVSTGKHFKKAVLDLC